MADDRAIILGTIDRAEAARVELLLRERGIEPIVSDSGAAVAIHGSSGFEFPVELRVPADRTAEAERIVAEFLASRSAEAEAVSVLPDPDDGPDPALDALRLPGPSLERSRDPVLAPLLGLTALHATLLILTGGASPLPGDHRLLDFGALRGWPPLDQWHRLVTYAFLHADLEHLAWNTVYLFLFGWGAIRIFGLARALFAYAVGAAASGAVSGWLIHDGVVVGASGAIFALVALVLTAHGRLSPLALHPRHRAFQIAGAAMFLLPGLFSHNLFAHLAGAAAGVLIGLAYDVHSPVVKPSAAGKLLGALGAAILFLPLARAFLSRFAHRL
jgi:membrane associated rhomboid family serine protease